MKLYEITYTGLFEDVCKMKITARNKTIAIQKFKGEMRPICKIISITEVE